MMIKGMQDLLKKQQEKPMTSMVIQIMSLKHKRRIKSKKTNKLIESQAVNNDVPAYSNWHDIVIQNCILEKKMEDWAKKLWEKDKESN